MQGLQAVNPNGDRGQFQDNTVREMLVAKKLQKFSTMIKASSLGVLYPDKERIMSETTMQHSLLMGEELRGMNLSATVLKNISQEFANTVVVR